MNARVKIKNALIDQAVLREFGLWVTFDVMLVGLLPLCLAASRAYSPAKIFEPEDAILLVYGLTASRAVAIVRDTRRPTPGRLSLAGCMLLFAMLAAVMFAVARDGGRKTSWLFLGIFSLVALSLMLASLIVTAHDNEGPEKPDNAPQSG